MLEKSHLLALLSNKYFLSIFQKKFNNPAKPRKRDGKRKILPIVTQKKKCIGSSARD